MKKLICFDLDGTLTQHRTKLDKKNKEFLDDLIRSGYRVIMVGAGTCERIYQQIDNYPLDIVANYGMQESKVIDGEFKIVKEITSNPDKEYFIEKIAYIRQKYGYTDYKGDGVEFHKTGMVTVPMLGTEADIKDKLAFDPTREKRQVIYPELLQLFSDYSVYIGGSSSFDFTEKQYNKYEATMNYARENGFTKEEVLFVGDDFGDGGGDSHVRIYGMDYVSIDDYKMVKEKVEEFLANYEAKNK